MLTLRLPEMWSLAVYIQCNYIIVGLEVDVNPSRSDSIKF